MVNLFQVSSAYGRAMESIDRLAMSKALFPVLAKLRRQGVLTELQVSSAIASCAEGYSFPTNLDRDPPLGGLAPKTQAALFRDALEGGWDAAQFHEALDVQAARRIP
jgi:ectoine hydroxylase-related dioxygenase (phytanoyl-CoA dioxygenase family)